MKEEFFPPIINRSLVLIMPKQPFTDWELSVFPNDRPVSTLIEEHNSYLVKESEKILTPKSALKNHWEWIFEHELEGICLDENKWPENRTWKMFTEWFDVKLSSLVLDLEENALVREEF